MNKIIKSQDGQQIHYMPTSTPCYFNIATVINNKGTIYSVGVNNISFGTFNKKPTAESALTELEDFLLDKSLRFQIPADK